MTLQVELGTREKRLGGWTAPSNGSKEPVEPNGRGDAGKMDARRAESGVAAPAATASDVSRAAPERTAFAVIVAISFCHCLNDLMQSLLPAIYPLIKETYRLDFGQIGLITLTFQLSASLLQPMVGYVTDRHPQPYSLAAGMGFSLAGLLLVATASSFVAILLAGAMIGVGSSIFHPESARMARVASGGRHGLAQSIFQVGGNFGQAVGPLLAALIVVPRGQGSVAWFSLVALLAMIVLTGVGRWYAARIRAGLVRRPAVTASHLSRGRIGFAIALLVLIVFSKNFYTASFTSYYTFYLIGRFGIPLQEAQVYLFVALASLALGTLIGGPLGDRIGRKPVIVGSVLGVLPFTLLLPYADLVWTVVLTVPIGLIMASSLPAVLIYALELVPSRVGLVAGLFFGLSFGMGGLGAALLGEIADHTSIGHVYRLCAWLPAIGAVALLLPRPGRAA